MPQPLRFDLVHCWGQLQLLSAARVAESGKADRCAHTGRPSCLPGAHWRSARDDGKPDFLPLGTVRRRQTEPLGQVSMRDASVCRMHRDNTSRVPEKTCPERRTASRHRRCPNQDIATPAAGARPTRIDCTSTEAGRQHP